MEQQQPARVGRRLAAIVQNARCDLLVGSNADVIHSNNVDHFFEPIDVLFNAREEVPDPNRPARFGNRSRMFATYLPAGERRWTHSR
jgi:hypothetical protein